MTLSWKDKAKYYSYLIARPPPSTLGYIVDESIEQKPSEKDETDISIQIQQEKKEDVALGEKELHVTDGPPDIFPHSHSYHVPLFTLTISIIELCVFLYYVIDLHKNHHKSITSGGPVPLCSVFIYNPFRRYEVWRFGSYLLVHVGWVHIFSNIAVQMFLGIPLEIVHGPVRLCGIYYAGVISGSLLTSITDSNIYLAGASGGVYALLLAHLPTIILNYREMKTFAEWIVSGVTICVGIFDLVFALYNRYHNGDDSIGYSAHIGGASAGFLIGMNILRNFHHKAWEGYLRLACFVLWISALIFAILYNTLSKSYPKTDWSSIKSCVGW